MAGLSKRPFFSALWRLSVPHTAPKLRNLVDHRPGNIMFVPGAASCSEPSPTAMVFLTEGAYMLDGEAGAVLRHQPAQDADTGAGRLCLT